MLSQKLCRAKTFLNRYVYMKSSFFCLICSPSSLQMSKVLLSIVAVFHTSAFKHESNVVQS